MQQGTFQGKAKICHDQLAELRRRIDAYGDREKEAFLKEAVEELSTAFEELQVASEELHQQSEGLTAASKLAEAKGLHYLELFDSAPEGYLVTDPHGVILEANRAASSLFSISQDFLIGKPLTVFVKKEDLNFFIARLNRLPALDHLENWEVCLKPPGKEIFPAVLTVTTVRDPKGDLVGLRWVVRDISESKAMEDQLRQSEDRLRFFSEKLLSIQEDERRNIARELHDRFEALLAAVRVNVEGVIQQLRNQRMDNVVQVLEIVLDNIQNASEEVQKIYMNLRPAILDDLGIKAAVNWYTREFQKSHPHICLEKDVDIEESQVPEPLKTVLYRVLQEVFSNMGRHSGKSDVIQLSLSKKRNQVEMIIRNNRRDFDSEDPLRGNESGSGLGLVGVRERVELSGGSFEIKSSKKTGTTVRASWPMEEGLQQPGKRSILPAPDFLCEPGGVDEPASRPTLVFKTS